MIPLNELALQCAHIEQQCLIVAGQHNVHVGKKSLSEFSDGTHYAMTMAHLARVLRDEFHCAHDAEEKAKKREAVNGAECSQITPCPSHQRGGWKPPPMPKPHLWDAYDGRCLRCGVLHDGAMAKLNCGSPVNNLPRAEITAGEVRT